MSCTFVKLVVDGLPRSERNTLVVIQNHASEGWARARNCGKRITNSNRCRRFLLSKRTAAVGCVHSCEKLGVYRELPCFVHVFGSAMVIRRTMMYYHLTRCVDVRMHGYSLLLSSVKLCSCSL
jgi:hypothetical protein